MTLESEQSEESDIKSNLPWILAFICIIAFYIIYSGKMGDIVRDKAEVYSYMAVGLICFVYFAKTWMYYDSPKLIWNDGFTTTMGEWDEAGNFAIIRHNSIHSKRIGWTFEGNDGVTIAPIDSINRAGKSIYLNVRAEKKKITELPSEVRRMIIAKKINPPYYIGYANEDQYSSYTTSKKGEPLSSVKVSFIVEQLTIANERIADLENTLSSILEGKLSIGQLEKKIKKTAMEYDELSLENVKNMFKDKKLKSE